MRETGIDNDASSSNGLGRRPLLAACVAGTTLTLAGHPVWAETRPPGGAIPFSVYRNGNRIGHHHTRFSESGDTLRVDIEIRLAVTFAGITLFRYAHDSVETWRDGRLISIDTRTEDDGRSFRASGQAEGGVFRVVEGRSGPWEAPAGVIPTSYWHSGVIRDEPLLHTQYGEPFEVSVQHLGRDTIEAAGRTIAADRYRLTENLVVDAWYDSADQWVKLSFDARGSAIEYVLDAGPPDAPTLTTRS